MITCSPLQQPSLPLPAAAAAAAVLLITAAAAKEVTTPACLPCAAPANPMHLICTEAERIHPCMPEGLSAAAPAVLLHHAQLHADLCAPARLQCCASYSWQPSR